MIMDQDCRRKHPHHWSSSGCSCSWRSGSTGTKLSRSFFSLQIFEFFSLQIFIEKYENYTIMRTFSDIMWTFCRWGLWQPAEELYWGHNNKMGLPGGSRPKKSTFEERKPFLGGWGAEQEQCRCPFGRQGLDNFIKNQTDKNEFRKILFWSYYQYPPKSLRKL